MKLLNFDWTVSLFYELLACLLGAEPVTDPFLIAIQLILIALVFSSFEDGPKFIASHVRPPFAPLVCATGTDAFITISGTR